MVLSREEGAKKERGRRQHRAVENGGWRFGFFKKRTNERTNERTNGADDEKRKRRRKTPVWYLNVQIVARGNDASFGASDFRHRAWSDRDRRRHLQKVFLVVVVFEEQSLSLSLSLSLSPIGMKRGGGAQKRGFFFSKNRETLNS